MFNNFWFNYFLILLSFIFTVLLYINPSVWLFWINHYFIDNWNYINYIIQLFVSNFIHWDFLHFLFNAVFLYLFWSQIELIIGQKKYIYFFIFVVVFNWILITNLSWYYTNTIGISWFCMAVLSYFVLELKSLNNPEYKWWITAIVINIMIWFIPWISLLWHLFWAIAWVIFYYINKQFFRPKFVWES